MSKYVSHRVIDVTMLTRETAIEWALEGCDGRAYKEYTCDGCGVLLCWECALWKSGAANQKKSWCPACYWARGGKHE